MKKNKQAPEIINNSVTISNDFWREQSKRIDWISPWKKISDYSFQSPVHIRWFEEGKLNASANCTDRHLKERGDKTAILWEPDHPDTPSRKLSFRELHTQTCQMAHVLQKNGVKKGDFVTIYMPMIPEAAIAMLACARIGAPHNVVFGGFSSESIADRMKDCKSRFVITADQGKRAGKEIALKHTLDEALRKVENVEKVFVVKHTGHPVPFHPPRDLWLLDEMKKQPSEHTAEVMDAEDPLFILYTSGSTNKPKGVLHTTGGYLVYASCTHELVFDAKPSDIYWCTADVGWITGHSYLVYGPLCNGVTTLLFEGVPTYPSPSRFWEVVDKHKVSIFYTAPTALRSLMREGDLPVEKTSRKSLRVLGSVGEPINPEAWLWYHRIVGGKRCPIVDTWWQTETGGVLISPLASQLGPQSVQKPGSATKPLFGVEAILVNDKGEILEGVAEGNLCLRNSWPGQMRTVYGDHKRFEQTYFSTYKGLYFTGDGAKRDADGDYWITGRVDDVINVSGHRIGTAEVESALVAHKSVAEAAVVGYPHDIKGQGIYAYVTLKTGIEPSDELKVELVQWVKYEIGAIALLDKLQWAPALPKTRSGKIMRRILRKIAEGETNLSNLGDTSTLADPGVVAQLIDQRQ